MSEPESSRAKHSYWAIIVMLALILTGIGVVLTHARLGEPRNMSVPMIKLAMKVRNARMYTIQIPVPWVQLCLAWDSWLGELQSQGPRLLRTEALWAPNDPLRRGIADFLDAANDFRPESLVPEAAVEKRLAVLANAPPDAVLREMQLVSVQERVAQASMQVLKLTLELENWPEWDRMRTLLKLMQDRGFTRAAAALQSRLPPARGSPGYARMNVVRTLKFLNDLSLDETGTVLLLNRWSEFSRLAVHQQASGDPEQQAVSRRLLEQLTDQPTLAEFADSLAAPLEEMRRWGRPAPEPEVRPAMGEKESVRQVRPLVPVQHVIPLVPIRTP